MTTTLLALAIIFTQLSLLAFGGGNSILPKCIGRSSMCSIG